MTFVQIIHIFREANMTADSLAKRSVDNELGLITFDFPPIHAAQAYLDDLAAVTRARRVSCSVS